MVLLLLLMLLPAAGCDYGRMYDQASVTTHEKKMPEMDPRTVPVRDGFESLARTDPKTLKNPLSSSKATVEQGRLAYGYFCIHCHGPGLDGNGTVGQSFAPLPANLLSSGVLSQKDGELYAKMRLGFKRHPSLFTTVSSGDAWAIILYVRSLRRSS